MRKLFFASAAALVAGLYAPAHADAGPLKRFVTTTVASVQSSSRMSAHQKSCAQASTGQMRHVGAVPSGCREGVGFSTISPNHALSMCCYSNSGLPIVDQSVVRGANGWYATKVYSSTPQTVSAPIRFVPVGSVSVRPTGISSTGQPISRVVTTDIPEVRPASFTAIDRIPPTNLPVCVNGTCRK
jgi:hypothetical protein